MSKIHTNTLGISSSEILGAHYCILTIFCNVIIILYYINIINVF